MSDRSSRTVSRRAAAKSIMAAGAAGLVGASLAKADQPHMQEARRLLRGAAHELDVAEADKGGHRAKAIRLVGDAIAEVEAGMQFAR